MPKPETAADARADVNTLDEVVLLGMRIGDQEQQQQLSARLSKADHARDAAFRAGATGAELDQLKVVRDDAAAELARVVKHQQEVEVAIMACRRPLIEKAHNDAHAAPAAVRAQVAADVADLEAAFAVTQAKASSLEAAQRRANQERAAYVARCQELGTEPDSRITWTISVPSDRLERVAAGMARVQRTVASLATRGLTP